MDKPIFRGVLFLWVGTLVSIILSLLLIHYKIRPGSESLPLHYNVLVGVDLLGPGSSLYRIPAIGVVVVVINFLLSKFVKSPSNLLSYLAAFVSFVVGLVLLFGVLFLLRVT